MKDRSISEYRKVPTVCPGAPAPAEHPPATETAVPPGEVVVAARDERVPSPTGSRSRRPQPKAESTTSESNAQSMRGDPSGARGARRGVARREGAQPGRGPRLRGAPVWEGSAPGQDPPAGGRAMRNGRATARESRLTTVCRARHPRAHPPREPCRRTAGPRRCRSTRSRVARRARGRGGWCAPFLRAPLDE